MVRVRGRGRGRGRGYAGGRKSSLMEGLDPHSSNCRRVHRGLGQGGALKSILIRVILG